MPQAFVVGANGPGLMLLQIVAFSVIELSLQWLFSDHTNPSPNAAFNSKHENHLFENLGLFLNPLFLMIMLARFMAGLYLPVLLWRRFLDRRLACAPVGFAVPLIVCAENDEVVAPIERRGTGSTPRSGARTAVLAPRAC